MFLPLTLDGFRGRSCVKPAPNCRIAERFVEIGVGLIHNAAWGSRWSEQNLPARGLKTRRRISHCRQVGEAGQTFWKMRLQDKLSFLP